MGPFLTDGLAQRREIILFDNAGVASSSGVVPQTFAAMARDAGRFIDALGVTRVHVLGYSIGSMIAQNVALERRDLVRKLMLAGSAPRNGDGIPLTPESQAIFTNVYGNLDDFWIVASSQHRRGARLPASRPFLKRVTLEQRIAIYPSMRRSSLLNSQPSGNGETRSANASHISKTLRIPVLVTGGKSDIISCTINSISGWMASSQHRPGGARLPAGRAFLKRRDAPVADRDLPIN